jgi:hypothetical protein
MSYLASIYIYRILLLAEREIKQLTDMQVGVNKPHAQKSGFLKKPDFSTFASFRFNYAYLLIDELISNKIYFSEAYIYHIFVI